MILHTNLELTLYLENFEKKSAKLPVLQTFFQNFQEKVSRGWLSTNFDMTFEPFDVKKSKKSIFCQQPIAQAAPQILLNSSTIG